MIYLFLLSHEVAQNERGEWEGERERLKKSEGEASRVKENKEQRE